MEGQGSLSALKKPPPLYRGIYLDYLESLTRGLGRIESQAA